MTEATAIGASASDAPTSDEQYKQLRDGLLEGIITADEDDLRELKTHIRSLALDACDRECMVRAVQSRLLCLTNVQTPILALRKEMTGPNRVLAMATNGCIPKWCGHWVWVANHNCFYNAKDSMFVSPQTFDMKHGCDVPEDRG